MGSADGQAPCLGTLSSAAELLGFPYAPVRFPGGVKLGAALSSKQGYELAFLPGRVAKVSSKASRAHCLGS